MTAHFLYNASRDGTDIWCACQEGFGTDDTAARTHLAGHFPAARVRIIVTLGCGHELEFFDKIEDKYPFWCTPCEDYFRTESYPWKLRTEIIATEGSTP